MKLEPEVEYGNKEYKLKIINKENDRLEKLASQLKWRLNEGNGEALYYIGVNDDGSVVGLGGNELKETIMNIKKMCEKINSKIISTEKINKYYVLKIRFIENEIKSKRILFIGPHNVGKTTLISNLTKNIKDDGDGFSRNFIFNHKHEIYSGMTSSITIENLKLKLNNYDLILNLIDTPGNFKYRKTLLRGINKYLPDLILLVLNPIEIDINTIKFYLDLLKFYEYEYKIIFCKNDLYNKNNKNFLIKFINDYLNKKICIIEINNINNLNYNKIIKLLINCNTNKLCKDNIKIQICDKLSIPNLKKIYTGLTFDDIKINKEYFIHSPNFSKKIIIDSIYFNDKSVETIQKNNLITFTIFNDNIYDNNSDIIITKNNNYTKFKELTIKCNKDIKNKNVLCFFNNQFNKLFIEKLHNNLFKITNIDNSNFININSKIIIKDNNEYYFCHLIEKL
jgi:GTPase SAR1 family protein